MRVILIIIAIGTITGIVREMMREETVMPVSTAAIPSYVEEYIKRYMTERGWEDIEMHFYKADSIETKCYEPVNRQMVIILITAKGRLENVPSRIADYKGHYDLVFAWYENKLQPANEYADMLWTDEEKHLPIVRTRRGFAARLIEGKVPPIILQGDCK